MKHLVFSYPLFADADGPIRRIVVDWEFIFRDEYMMEVMRQFRAGLPEEREKVNWQREGF